MLLLSRLPWALVSCLSSGVCAVDFLRRSLFVFASLLQSQAAWGPLTRLSFLQALVGAAPSGSEEEVHGIESLHHGSTVLIVQDFESHYHFPIRLCLPSSTCAKAVCALAQVCSGFQSALHTARLLVLLLQRLLYSGRFSEDVTSFSMGVDIGTEGKGTLILLAQQLVIRVSLVPGRHRASHPEIISVCPRVAAWAGAGSPWRHSSGAENVHVDSGWASSRSSRSGHKALKHSAPLDLLLKRQQKVCIQVFKKSHNISSWLDVYLARISKRKLVQ